MTQDLDKEIIHLEDLGLDGLRKEWKDRFGEASPTWRSPDLLRRFLASRIQEQASGGVSPEAARQLRKLARAFDRDPDHPLHPILGLKPGTVLTREWQGVVHQVRVLENGFEYAGEKFTSLSEIARKITGTRWSGPLFFGLKP